MAKVDKDRQRLQSEVRKLEATVSAQTTHLAKKDEDIAMLKGQIRIGKRTYIRTLIFRLFYTLFAYVL
jgi:hypothetical protein